MGGVGEESPRGTRCGHSLVGFSRASRLGPVFLMYRWEGDSGDRAQLPHFTDGEQRPGWMKGHTSGRMASWWQSRGRDLERLTCLSSEPFSVHSCLQNG